MRIIQRIGLATGALVSLIIGGWAQFAPRSFYDDFPTVDLTPPFSEHLMRDFGGATLGLGVVFAIAFFLPDTVLGLVAPIAYLVFAVPHFAFHLHHLGGATTGEAALLVTELALSVLLPAMLIVIAVVRMQRDRRVRHPAVG